MISKLSAALLTFCLASCADFGPYTVRHERIGYNEAAHNTAGEQLLLNIVRTKEYEATAFSDFVEYDSTPSTSASLTGGATSLFGLAAGSIAPTFGVGEQSLQKTTLLTGQQLAQQISSPLTLRSIRRLSLANEPDVPLLRLTVSRFGDFTDYNRAVDLINFLDIYGAVLLDSRTENTLNILFQTGFLRTPNESVGADDPLHCFKEKDASKNVSLFKAQLISILGGRTNDRITLRTSEANLSNGEEKGNELKIASASSAGSRLISTGTALGALRQTLDGHTFYFAEHGHAEAQELRDRNNACECARVSDFYLKNASSGSPDIEHLWREFFDFPYQDDQRAKAQAREVGANTVLVIIEKSRDEPVNSYVSTFKDGYWYSIDDSDDKSKKNFLLLNNILNIQAAPVNNTPTPTTISAGPSH